MFASFRSIVLLGTLVFLGAGSVLAQGVNPTRSHVYRGRITHVHRHANGHSITVHLRHHGRRTFRVDQLTRVTGGHLHHGEHVTVRAHHHHADHVTIHHRHFARSAQTGLPAMTRLGLPGTSRVAMQARTAGPRRQPTTTVAHRNVTTPNHGRHVVRPAMTHHRKR
jgi:hypothetical protein